MTATSAAFHCLLCCAEIPPPLLLDPSRQHRPAALCVRPWWHGRWLLLQPDGVDAQCDGGVRQRGRDVAGQVRARSQPAWLPLVPLTGDGPAQTLASFERRLGSGQLYCRPGGAAVVRPLVGRTSGTTDQAGLIGVLRAACSFEQLRSWGMLGGRGGEPVSIGCATPADGVNRVGRFVLIESERHAVWGEACTSPCGARQVLKRVLMSVGTPGPSRTL